ncbi:MAG: cytochrome c6 PetJ [Heteroscytonema crispum UTEX LB 1556]
MKTLLNFVILTFFVLSISFIPPALAANADIANGAQIFETNCAGCHINGGNIIRRGKNLKMKALKKNNMNSIEAIASIVANGKNNMSAYKDRLSEQQIQDVATYVLQQAENNWR